MEKKRERNINVWLPLEHLPREIWPVTQGPFGSQASAQSIEPHQPGFFPSFFPSFLPSFLLIFCSFMSFNISLTCNLKSLMSTLSLAAAPSYTDRSSLIDLCSSMSSPILLETLSQIKILIDILVISIIVLSLSWLGYLKVTLHT